MRLAKATIFGCLTALVLIGFESASGRQTPPSSRPASTLERAVVETIDTGANLFNAGDDAACYRLYQGALIGFKPSLEGHPDTYRLVLAHQSEAAKAQTVAEKAFALRKALDAILVLARSKPAIAAKSAEPAPAVAEVPKAKPEPKPEAMPKEPIAAKVPAATPKVGGRQPSPTSLWSRLGGIEVIKPAAADWINRCLADPKVDFTRGGKYPLDAVGRSNLEQLMIQYLSEATGGPETYTGRSMKDAHLGMKITEDQFFASLQHLAAAFRERGATRVELNELLAFITKSQPEVATAGVVPPALDMPKRAPAAPATSLWDKVGGEKVMAEVMKELIEKAIANPKVDFTRGGKYPLDAAAKTKLERKFLEYFSSRMGGPLKYEGKSMKAAHEKMDINADQFDALGGDLILVMKRRQISDALIDEMLGVFNEAFDPIVEKK